MNFLTYGTGLLGTWDDPALSCTASCGGGASHETPSALEPASYARAGEARLVERDLGEDAFWFFFLLNERRCIRIHVLQVYVKKRTWHSSTKAYLVSVIEDCISTCISTAFLVPVAKMKQKVGEHLLHDQSKSGIA